MWVIVFKIIICILVIILCLGFFSMLWVDIIQNRCPKCKKWNYETIDKHDNYCCVQCKNCKHVWKQVFG